MANETALSLTYAPLLTSTLFNYVNANSFTDNVFDATPSLKWYKGSQKLKSGGERLSVAIMHETNSTVNSYSGLDVLDTSESTGFTRAFFPWRLYSASIVISGDELTSNMGEAELFDLLNAKTTQAELSLANRLSTDLYTDGTGNSSKNLTGLVAQVDSTPTVGTYASINRANNTAWQNQAQASVGAAATNLLSNLRTQYNNCTQGKGGLGSKADGISTTQTVHESFEALMFPFLQYRGDSSSDNSVNAGLSNLRYKNAEVFWDADVPSGELYILNSNHSYLCVHRERDMTMAEGGFQKPVNQDGLICQILWKGQLATDAPKKLAVLTGIN